MINQKNTFVSLAEQLALLNKNSIEVMTKLNDVVTNRNSVVNVTLMNSDGTSSTYQFPTVGQLKNEIDIANRNIRKLAGLADSTAYVSDGTTMRRVYVDSTGDHGLVASKDNLGGKWGCVNQLIGGTSEGIVDYPQTSIGMNNSNIINSNCSESSIAAKICLNYSSEGYNNWFLPSKDELNLMYLNIKETLLSNYYWSSSEFNEKFAWQQHFQTGTQYKIYKNITANVRPVRKF